MCSNLNERVTQLNNERHAGTSDWIISFYYYCENAGHYESVIHKELHSYKVRDKKYLKNGEEINCREVFTCTTEYAKAVIEKKSGDILLSTKAMSNVITNIKKAGTFNRSNLKTVENFAGELKLPTALLIEQLKSAGVHKSNADDQLSEADKATLLNHLRKEHGTLAPKNKITLTRKANEGILTPESRNIDSRIIRTHGIQDRHNAKQATQSLNESDALRDKYFEMSYNQLQGLWNNGINDFEQDEKIIIRAAIKRNISTEVQGNEF